MSPRHETPLYVEKFAIGAIKEAYQSCPPKIESIDTAPTASKTPERGRICKMDATVGNERKIFVMTLSAISG